MDLFTNLRLMTTQERRNALIDCISAVCELDGALGFDCALRELHEADEGAYDELEAAFDERR